MNTGFKIFLKILGGLLGTVAGIIILLCLAITIFFHAKFTEFYSIKKNIAPNPGLWANFVPQGITFNDDENYFATCGYMKDSTASRLYTIDKKTKKIKMYKLTSNGEDYAGHTGGLQYTNGQFYIASEQEGVFIFDADFDKKSKKVEIGLPTKVENNSSFVFSDDEFLYVGEFAHVPEYPCIHGITFKGKTNTAVMSKYKIGDLSKPLAIYSIPDEVQGVGVTKDGDMIFSRSWGITFAKYDAYSVNSIEETGMSFDGIPVFFLGEPDKSVDSSFFTEDIDIIGDEIVSMTEAAANKYWIGKFYFDYSIFKMKIDRFFSR
ncbi:MAG: hypothetical protein ACTTHG_04270 [Treponemataceae bacterium]